jgi:predicted DNA-binding WGR domain protein
LKANGWNICQIYSKDWIENKPRVLKMIAASLNNELFFEEIEIENSLIEIESIEEETKDPSSKESTDFEKYINTSNGSNKFWEIGTDGKNVIVQYGRIGTKGQRMVKAFESEDDAIKEKRKLISQKLAKEYFKE